MVEARLATTVLVLAGVAYMWWNTEREEAVGSAIIGFIVLLALAVWWTE